jgi:uncharacterized protein YndB with AHSA1/START domain
MTESRTQVSPVIPGSDLMITRTFDAPRVVVYRAWTDAERFVKWFGPRDSTIPFCRLEAHPGGNLHFCHDLGDDQVWIRGRFEEVEEPVRLVFTTYFSNEEGDRRDRLGFPTDMRIAVDFDEEGDGTRMTIRQSGLQKDQGEVEGWIEAMERLAEELESG